MLHSLLLDLLSVEHLLLLLSSRVGIGHHVYVLAGHSRLRCSISRRNADRDHHLSSFLCQHALLLLLRREILHVTHERSKIWISTHRCRWLGLSVHRTRVHRPLRLHLRCNWPVLRLLLGESKLLLLLGLSLLSLGLLLHPLTSLLAKPVHSLIAIIHEDRVNALRLVLAELGRVHPLLQ